MRSKMLLSLSMTAALLLAACGSPSQLPISQTGASSGSGIAARPDPMAQSQPSALAVAPHTHAHGEEADHEHSAISAGEETTYAPSITATSSGVDLTRLPVGDTRHSTGPLAGYIWPCSINPNAGGSQVEGPWFNGDGTYDLTKKAVVDGAVSWPSQFSIALQGGQRVFSTNDLPSHTTGNYPVAPSDDVYAYDRNPNSIAAQSISFALPANPTMAAQPSCTPGAIGILLSGSVLFNALDGPGRDAVAHEAQDSCQGHPQQSGAYHYHSLTDCIADTPGPDGHSALMGYLLDGFGIYGRYGEGGQLLSSADLDACHGHTHAISWDGQLVEMYHYHATWDFPYTAGCIVGTFDPNISRLLSGGAGAGQPIQQPGGDLPSSPPFGQPAPPPGGRPGGRPPRP